MRLGERETYESYLVPGDQRVPYDSLRSALRNCLYHVDQLERAVAAAQPALDEITTRCARYIARIAELEAERPGCRCRQCGQPLPIARTGAGHERSGLSGAMPARASTKEMTP